MTPDSPDAIAIALATRALCLAPPAPYAGLACTDTPDGLVVQVVMGPDVATFDAALEETGASVLLLTRWRDQPCMGTA